MHIESEGVEGGMRGFQKTGGKGNLVTLNKTSTLNLVLQVSAVQASVTVNDAAQLIEVTSGQIGRSIDDVMLSQLPVSGRDFRTILSIFPGFQTNPSPGQNNYTLSSGSSVSFNDTCTRRTSFSTDGSENDDYSENQNLTPLNVN